MRHFKTISRNDESFVFSLFYLYSTEYLWIFMANYFTSQQRNQAPLMIRLHAVLRLCCLFCLHSKKRQQQLLSLFSQARSYESCCCWGRYLWVTQAWRLHRGGLLLQSRACPAALRFLCRSRRLAEPLYIPAAGSGTVRGGAPRLLPAARRVCALDQSQLSSARQARAKAQPNKWSLIDPH